MRLWLNRSAEISLREQLTTQVRLAILCRELRPGERLPSTRELARRFGIHADTASAAYGELERDGWLEFRHGSGVYVRATRPALLQTPELDLELRVDELIGELARKARKAGAPASLVRERVRRWLQMEPPGRWLVIEPDAELRAIVIHEMETAVQLPVHGCAPEECDLTGVVNGAMPVVLPSKAPAVRRLLPPGTDLTVIEVHPVGPELNRFLPAPPGVLVGIASRWNEFQRLARTMLIAAGIAPDSLLIRDATQLGWKRGLTVTAGVVCDALTATQLPSECRPIEFRLLAEEALAQLRTAEAALPATPDA